MRGGVNMILSVNMILICSVAFNGQRAAAFIHAQISGIQRSFQQQREHYGKSNCLRMREYLCEPSAITDITSSRWLRLTVVSGFVEMKASDAVEKATMKGHLIFGLKGKKNSTKASTRKSPAVPFASG